MDRSRPRFGLPAGIAAVAVVAALLAPAVADDADLRTLAGVFMFAALASAWNIIGGFAGYASFGNVVFFGLGGYSVAVLVVVLIVRPSGLLGRPFYEARVEAA